MCDVQILPEDGELDDSSGGNVNCNQRTFKSEFHVHMGWMHSKITFGGNWRAHLTMNSHVYNFVQINGPI